MSLLSRRGQSRPGARLLLSTLSLAAFLQARAASADEVTYLPGAAETQGQSGSRFSSTLVLTNTTDTPASVRIGLIPSAGKTRPGDALRTVAAGETQRIPAVLPALFGAGQDAGTLVVTSSGPLVFSLATQNVADPSAAYGLGLQPVPEAALIAAGQVAHSIWASQSADGSRGFRTNVAVTLVDPSSAVDVDVYDETGALKGHTTVASATPVAWQARLTDIAGGIALEHGRVAFSVTAGRATAYTVVNDNVTSDAIASQAVVVAGSGVTDVLVDGAAKTPGSAGAFWSSDIRLFNPGAVPVSVTIEAKGFSSTTAPVVVAVPPKALVEVPKVLDRFGLPDGSAGALRVTAGSPILVGARTQNVDPTGVRAGTFSAQQYPMNLADGLVGAGSKGFFIGVDQTFAVPGVRTNVALFGGPTGAQGRLVLRDETGTEKAATPFNRGAFEWGQLNVADWFPSASAARRSADGTSLAAFPANSRIDVEVTTGSVDGYVSRIDNGSNDPVTQPLAEDPAHCGVPPFSVDPFTLTPSPLPVGQTGTLAWDFKQNGQPFSVSDQDLVIDGGAPISLQNQVRSYVLPAFATSGPHHATINARHGCRTTTRTLDFFVCGTLTITPDSLPDATALQPYSQTLVSNGTAPVAWTRTGALPTGITFDGATGILSGTPTQRGNFTSTYTATDANGCTGTKTLTLRVVCPTITVFPATLPNGLSGSAYGPVNFTHTGGAPGGTWSSTVLPAGMTFSAGGVLSGTPTVSGTFTVTFQFTDSLGCVGARTITFTICNPISVNPPSLPAGTATVAYSQPITQTGGTGATTFAVTAGALPAGLTLTTGGLLSGTPTQTGTFNFTVTATDSLGCTGSRGYALVINCPTITVNPATLPNATAANPYSQTITATGGVGTYTFAVTAGALPAGLTLTTAGFLSGTPTVTGPFNFTITATDSNGCTGSRAYTLTVVCPTITVAPATLPNATAANAYSQTITASGGIAPYTFAVTAGALPAGLTLSAAGLLSGTPTVTGPFSFTITATDANGCTGSTAYTLTVVCPTITVNPATLPNGVVGTAYSQTVTASGGIGPYTFAVTAGALPTGLTLNPGTGAITGTPSAAGPYSFTITATDANGCTGLRAYSVTMVCPAITLSPGTLPGGTAGTAYSQTITASGGTAPYTFALTAGTLPTGLTLSTAGVLSGTPTAAGTFNFTVTGTDTYGCTGAQAYSVTIVCPVVTVTPGTLPNGVVGTAYSQTVAGAGGTAPYTFAVTAGALPTSLTLNPGTGAITGTPSAAGLFGFTITATDANGCSGSTVYSVRICPVITVAPATLPGPQQGVPYTATVVASGSAATPYTYSVTAGALPAGLSLNTSTGDITGTPTTLGPYSVTITATDANGCTGSTAYTGQVCPVITVAPGTLPNGVVGTAYSQTVTASGSAATPFTYSVTAGALPTSLTLNPATGLISGTPSAAGLFSFTITGTDANGCTGSTAYTVRICPVITLAPATLATGFLSTPYSQTIVASGGTGPYTYAVTSGSLPPGLGLNTSTGDITGSPTTSGDYPFTVTATDANGCTGSRAYSIKICPVLTIGPGTLPGATVGTAYNQTVTASGGTAPYGYAVTSGALPTGLTLAPATGAITGTPTAANTFNFTITATDVNGCNGSQAYSIVVTCPTITVNPATLPNATATQAYSQTITATGGSAPYTFAVTSGALPTGLTLNSGGLLSGTPLVQGSFNFTITATDNFGCTGARAYTLTVDCPTITVNPATLPNGTVGTAYSQTVSAVGGIGPHTFAVTSGALPTGLSLNPVSGAITGTPSAANTFSFTITATDTIGCTGSRGYTVTTSCPLITVAPPTLPNGLIGSPYSQTVSASGGSPAYTYTVTSGALPNGLSLNPVSGDITGTPTVVGPFSFTVTATDVFGCTGATAYNVRICPVITVTPGTLPNGVVGTPYTQTVAGSGGVAPYTFAVTSGALPTSLSLNPATGDITGTPTVAGVFNFTITATDANGCTGSTAYSVRICPVITVNPATLPNGTVGTPYSQTVSGSGGAAPYTFAVTSGALPTSLSLNTSTGDITGTPTVAGLFSFTITATDANGCTGSRAYANVRICPNVTLAAVATCATVGGAYSSSAVASPAGTYTYAVTAGALPAGVTLNTSTGALTGTPTTAGAPSFTITATDTNGCAGSQAYTVNVLDLVPAAGALTAGTYGVAYSQSFTGSGGSGGFTYALTAGTVANGLSLSSGGVLSGTPTGATGTGNFSFTVTATNTATTCTVSKAYTLLVQPNAQPDTFNNGVGNTQYVSAAACPVAGTPNVCSTTNILTNDQGPGPLTAGPGVIAAANGSVAMNANGTFTYTPNVGFAGPSDTFTYTLTDGNGITNTAVVTINISGRVWYVNHGFAAASHDGRSNTPFQDFGAGVGNFGSATTFTGDTIFVHTGSATTTGNVTLLANQRLWGNGVTLTMSGLTITAGTKPMMNGTATLANDTTVTGITFNPSGAISALTGSGLTGTITIDQNTISANNAGTAVSLSTGTADVNVTNTPLSQSGAGTGLAVNGKTGGTVSFDSLSTISVTGAGATGINLTGNNGATFTFAGTLTLTTTTGNAFIATGPGPAATSGGTVSATAVNNVVTTTTGTAINVAHTTIAAANLTFQSVSSNGGANGISLNNTGSSGGLKVTGTGTTAGSGGTIQNKTAPGVLLMTTSGVSLSNMNIQNGTDDGIHGESVTNLDLIGCNVTGNGNSTTDDGLQLGLESGATVGISGTLNITNTSISSNAHNGVHIRNTSGTLTAMNISGSSFNNATGPSSANAFLFEASGTSVTTAATISTSTFANSTPQRALEVQTHDTATITSFTVQTSTFTNNGIHASFTQDTASNLTFKFLNNLNMTGSLLQPINVFSSSTSTGGNINGRIQGNTIGNAGVPGSGSNGGSGIRVLIQGRTTSSILIDSNTIRQVGFTSGARGMDLQYLGPTALAQPITQSDLTITNNFVQTDAPPATFPLAAIFIGADNQGSPARVRADVRTNTVPATGCFDYPTFSGTDGQLSYVLVTAGAQAQLVDNPPGSATAQAELTSHNTGLMYGDPAVTLIAGPITTPP